MNKTDTIDRGKQMAARYLKILFQAYKPLFTAHCFLFLLIFVLLLGFNMPHGMLTDAVYYLVASGLSLLSLEHVFNVPADGEIIKQSVQSLTNSAYYTNQATEFFYYVIYGAKHSLDLSSMIMVLPLIEKIARARIKAKKMRQGSRPI